MKNENNAEGGVEGDIFHVTSYLGKNRTVRDVMARRATKLERRVPWLQESFPSISSFTCRLSKYPYVEFYTYSYNSLVILE